ncbi:MAG: hypothetical protein BWY44_00822 [Candidatus Omnitrophica bacterium ADurb.Bin292]|nr:MAG: hypothetical protein BWY44_00822 [Candidatus Omnitrophica bacterium ADurb.Bin292]
MSDPLVLIFNGRNQGRLPKKSSVFCFVMKIPLPLLTRQDGFPEFFIKFLGSLPGFQHTRVLANRFFRRVTGHLHKLGINVFNIPLFVCNDNGSRTLLHRFGKLSYFFVRNASFGGVEKRYDSTRHFPVDPLGERPVLHGKTGAIGTPQTFIFNMNSLTFAQHLAYFTGIGRYWVPLHIRMMDHLVNILAQKLVCAFVAQHSETGRIGKSTIPFKINPINRFSRRVQ